MGNRSKNCLLLITLACALLGGCGEQADVVMVNSEKEANLILVEFERRGITAPSKTQQTVDRKVVWSIRCSPEQASQARQILVKLDLPREERGGLESMINSTGLIPTKTDERAKLMHAIAQELETTFETYDRVVRARVHVVIPDSEMSLTADPEKSPKPSATVLLKYRAGDGASDGTPDPSQAGPPMKEEDVQQIVARSVAGLEQTSVFVTFTPTEVVASNITEVVASPGSKSMLYQLYAAVVLLGVFCVFLIVKLLKKPSTTDATPAGAAG